MIYTKFNDEKFYKNVPNEPGVYFIYSLCNDNYPKSIQRVLNTDSNGILYIGKSKNLKERLRMLFRVLNPIKYKAIAHTFGKNYNNSQSLQEAFPLKTLAFTIHLTDNYSEFEKLELKKYCNQFGEVPPFNFTM